MTRENICFTYFKSCLSLYLYLGKCENSWYFLLSLLCFFVKWYSQDKNDHVVTSSTCQIQVKYIPNVNKLCHLYFNKPHPNHHFLSLGQVKQPPDHSCCLQLCPLPCIHHTSGRLIFRIKNVNLMLLYSHCELSNSFPLQSLLTTTTNYTTNSLPWSLPAMFWPLQHFRLHPPVCPLRFLAFFVSLERVVAFLSQSSFGFVLLSVAPKTEGKAATQLLWLLMHRWK